MKLTRRTSASFSPSPSYPHAAGRNARPRSRGTPPAHPRPMMQPLPRPRRTGPGKGLVAAALLSLLAVAAAVYWVTRDDIQRETLRRDARAFLWERTRDTPLEDLAARLLPAEAVPADAADAIDASGEESPVVFQEEDGSLAGRIIAARVTPPPAAVPETPLPVPQLRTDDRVTPVFITDVARFLVARYSPAGVEGGSLPLSPQQLNQHYGVRLTGLSAGGGDARTRRAAVLRYAFHPVMLQALYDIYADRFMDAVIKEAMHPARGRSLSEAQTRRLCLVVGGRFILLAGALDGVRKTRDMRDLLDAVDRRSQEAQTALERMQGAMLRLDEARARDGEAAARGRGEVDRAETAYRAALQGRDEARRAIAAAVRRAGGQGFDDASLIYLAAWVDRRLREDAHAGEAVETAVRLLRDLGRRFARAGTRGLPEPLEERLAREREGASVRRTQALPADPDAPARGGEEVPPDSGERLLPRPPDMPAGGGLRPPVSPPAIPAGAARP